MRTVDPGVDYCHIGIDPIVDAVDPGLRCRTPRVAIDAVDARWYRLLECHSRAVRLDE